MARLRNLFLVLGLVASAGAAGGGDPGRPAAKRTMAGAVEPIRSHPQASQDLDVGAKQGPRKIVFSGLMLAAPPVEQARPGPGSVLPLPGLGHIRQAGGAVLRGEAEQTATTVEEAIGVRFQPARKRALGVQELDGGGQPPLDPVEPASETEGLGGGHGPAREELRARSALLERGLDGAFRDGGIPHPALRDTSEGDAAAPTAC